jgi:hypothetical protein
MCVVTLDVHMRWHVCSNTSRFYESRRNCRKNMARNTVLLPVQTSKDLSASALLNCTRMILNSFTERRAGMCTSPGSCSRGPSFRSGPSD